MSCESNCRMENSLSMRSSLSVNPPSVNGNAFESSPSDTVLPVSLSMRSSLLPVTLFSQCHCQCVRVFLPVSLSMRSSLSFLILHATIGLTNYLNHPFLHPLDPMGHIRSSHRLSTYLSPFLSPPFIYHLFNSQFHPTQTHTLSQRASQFF